MKCGHCTNTIQLWEEACLLNKADVLYNHRECLDGKEPIKVLPTIGEPPHAVSNKGNTAQASAGQ